MLLENKSLRLLNMRIFVFENNTQNKGMLKYLIDILFIYILLLFLYKVNFYKSTSWIYEILNIYINFWVW